MIVCCLRDDVGDHALWSKQFEAQRILHSEEVVPDTEGVEVKLSGAGPWQLPDGSDDVEMVFTPGHTSAHVCLYYKPDKAIFTGELAAQVNMLLCTPLHAQGYCLRIRSMSFCSQLTLS